MGASSGLTTATRRGAVVLSGVLAASVWLPAPSSTPAVPPPASSTSAEAPATTESAAEGLSIPAPPPVAASAVEPPAPEQPDTPPPRPAPADPPPVDDTTAGDPATHDHASSRERGQQALARVDYPWRELGYTVVFEGPRPGYRAMTYPGPRRIEVYVRSADPVEQLATDVAHELGHAVDFVHGTAERRARWRELRGIPADRDWYGCSECGDFDTPAGDFAEVFAYWQVGAARYFQSRVAPLPDAEQLDRLIPLMQPRRDGSEPADAGSDGASGDGDSDRGTGGEDPDSEGDDGGDDSGAGQLVGL